MLSGTPDLSTDATATSPVAGSPYAITVTNGTLLGIIGNGNGTTNPLHRLLLQAGARGTNLSDAEFMQ